MLQRSVNHVIMMVTDDIDDAIRLWWLHGATKQKC